MRKAFRHSGVLLGSMIVALGLLGAAYTLWYEDLSLTANVTTGTFNAALSVHDLDTTTANSAVNVGLPVVGLPTVSGVNGGVATYLDPVPDTPPRDFIDGASGYSNFTNANFGAKPQPTCGATLSTDPALDANDQGDTNSLVLDMSGLFPYAGCEYEIDITSVGSVPLHFGVTSLTFYECTGHGTGCSVSNGENAPWSLGLDPGQSSLAQCAAWLGNTFGKVVGPGGSPTIHGFNGGTGWIGGIQINTAVSSPLANSVAITNAGATTPIQLHQGDSLNCRFKLILDQNGQAEGKHYQFKATYKAYQWNENPFAP
jgi:hypothetical protein